MIRRPIFGTGPTTKDRCTPFAIFLRDGGRFFESGAAGTHFGNLIAGVFLQEMPALFTGKTRLLSRWCPSNLKA